MIDTTADQTINVTATFRPGQVILMPPDAKPEYIVPVADDKCARTACTRRGAICQHKDTKRMYCVPCARHINHYNPSTPPLVNIPEKR
jgi:hypothetical protein